jgi:hypothetical protein
VHVHCGWSTGERGKGKGRNGSWIADGRLVGLGFVNVAQTPPIATWDGWGTGGSGLCHCATLSVVEGTGIMDWK